MESLRHSPGGGKIKISPDPREQKSVFEATLGRLPMGFRDPNSEKFV